MNVIFTFSDLPPFLVWISTTPFAAREPYIAAEEASLSTSIRSISEGLMSFILSEGIPSITYRGSLFPNVPIPRIRMEVPEPGAPLLCSTVTPDMRPCRALLIPDTDMSFRLPIFTDETDPVRSAFLWVEYPTTTTSSNAFTFSLSEMLKKVLSPIVICWLIKPT